MDFSNYTIEDIVDELFIFTDALRDENILTDYECEVIDVLKERFCKLCTIE